MISSQLVLLLAASVSAQSTVNLWSVDLWPIDANSTATIVGSNPAATTYAFNCPPASSLAPSAASSVKSAASSAAAEASSALASLGIDGSLISSAQSAGASAASSAKSAANVELTPIPKPTNARRDNVRLLPIPKPTQARRDNVRLLPIAKPTLAARADLPPMDVDIPCVPVTVVQGSETYGIVAATKVPIAFNAEFNATWKGDVKSAEVTATLVWGGDISMLNRPLTTAKAPSDELFTTSVAVAVVSASATSSGSSSPSGTSSSSPSGSAGASGSAPAANSNPGAAGPLPTGPAVYVGAAAGIFGAMLAL